MVSKETLDADEAQQGQYEGAIQSDKAAIETAQLQLDWCYIQSPIDGTIGLRLVDPGNIITANTTNLVIINQFKPIAVYFTLPENQLPQVLQSLAADKRMPVDAYDRSDHAKADQRLAADRRQPDRHHDRNRQAEGRLRQPRLSRCFPTSSSTFIWCLRTVPNALVVPSAAIQTGVQGLAVRVGHRCRCDKGGQAAQMQPVKVALAEGQVTILDSGLEPVPKWWWTAPTGCVPASP